MTEYEYELSGPFGNWMLYAEYTLKIPTNKATVMWKNAHNVGKYLICEARESSSTRLFIRIVTNLMEDGFKKSGWWNTFTVTKNPVSKGLWLTKVVEYRLDRNGYVNLEVEPVIPIHEFKFHTLFGEKNGTWNSIAWWFLIIKSEAFLKEYEFKNHSHHQANYSALVKRFPDLEGMNSYEMGKEMLHKYLRDEVSFEEIEDALNTPSDWEQFVMDVQKAVAYRYVDKLYADNYPIFSKKIRNNVVKDGMIDRYDVENYLQRQLDYYDKLVKEQKIESLDSGWLDKIEAALRYRKALKDAEKEARKKKRKH